MRSKLILALGYLALALPVFFGTQVLAQDNTGSILGTVRSASGPVAGAHVKAVNTATGKTLTTSTASRGAFRLTQVPVGTYEVSLSASGYQTISVVAPVALGEGTTINPMMQEGAMDEIVVTSEALSRIDVTSAEMTTVLTAADIERVPLMRDINAIALVAPGAIMGDQTFGGDGSQDRQHYSTRSPLVSFGGSSVAENTYFINGFNVTNFRNGLGGGALPFHFYDQFQLKTGGFGAEFGRSTGGVINAITKSGTNEWQFGGGAYFEPDSIRGESPDVFDRDGNLSVKKKGDTKGGQEVYLYASGPIVKDKLLIYATYAARDYIRENFTTSQFNDDTDEDPFWGAKIDWYISDDHSLEVTAFSDKHTTIQKQFAYDSATNTIGAQKENNAVFDRGGDVTIVKYTGHITDNFSVSALYGTSEYDINTGGGEADAVCPTIFDVRGAATLTPGCWVVQIPEKGTDERDAFRIDAEWFVGDKHLLRFGIDIEETTSTHLGHYGALGSGAAVGGGTRYFYSLDSSSSTGERVQVRELLNQGSFETSTDAIYLEDEWSVTDNLTLRLGIRSEEFENLNADGDQFIKIDDQIAPRIGISWDVKGDGTSKLFANFGRYHLPIASNTNIRLGGSEYFSQQNFELISVNPDGTPVIGPALSGLAVFGDGTIQDVRTAIDTTIEPMYQDEYILGYERELWGGDWIGSIVGTYRDLTSTIEDITIDFALGQAFEFHYILTNPGTSVTTFYDCAPLDANGACTYDGVLEEYNWTAEEMGFPDAERTYEAVTVTLERPWDGRFFLYASYTWSRSEGNIEGYVRSDNGQDDAGLTTLYDFPGLMDNANGKLPNDRTHSLKIAATWEFAEGWQVGTYTSIQSGRPKNAFSVHPTEPFSFFYEDESYFNRGVPAPRGSLGRTPTITNIDLSLKYIRDMGNGSTFTARLDVFNVFDFDKAIEVDESSDEGSSCPPTNVQVCDPLTGFYGDNPAFHTPVWFQTPRTVRFGITYDFGS